ncbi:MAG: DUF975 family protein [Clostridia bacterium]|nr:DUF975 family protein [Clostridia bacterium]
MGEHAVIRENYEIRADARRVLAGKWGAAVLMVLVFSLISGIAGSGSGFRESAEEFDFPRVLTILAVLASLFALAYGILVSNVISYGFTIAFLRPGRENRIVFEDLFLGFKSYGRVVAMMLLKSIFIFLWSLLLLIPGIVKTYAYGMAEYILYDNPGMEPNQAITKSKEMMYGHKGRLFILDLSLIGWWLLSILTCGIGFLWLGAYYKTIHAIFYMDLTGTARPERSEADEYILEAAQKEIERLNKEGL